ncbi:hypothetical protein PISMIDRAFT_624109 [Pisolithus microcarpus 441]|uniref:Uncharacterized protein n=1 Tax=Pisolithus microcarpus 441 TaxID=765257 RepID=A0A0C9ZHW6_9AGAM|nr:hypothetical protein PISMIDRAFT_624109 [Pisolithus microcarpus 441]
MGTQVVRCSFIHPPSALSLAVPCVSSVTVRYNTCSRALSKWWSFFSSCPRLPSIPLLAVLRQPRSAGASTFHTLTSTASLAVQHILAQLFLGICTTKCLTALLLRALNTP